MPSRGFLRRLLVLGERQALQDLKVYTDLAQKATDILSSQLLQPSTEQEYSVDKIRTIEKQGDDLTMSLKSDITQGAINSTLLGHLLNLVETCDDILDKTLYLSREIYRMSHFLRLNPELAGYVKDEAYTKFSTMLEYNKKALTNLQNMLNANDLEHLKSERKSIESLEEVVDDIKDDLIDQVYVNAKGLHYLVFTHVMNTVHRIDDLLDDCEDASDLVMTISNSVNR
ncbi:MAG: DUF47 family protein [Candidatus Thermoplasmatota archaeon]|nr:DUF47 family protein [Candidatus Thermoplasmatota archaeon]